MSKGNNRCPKCGGPTKCVDGTLGHGYRCLCGDCTGFIRDSDPVTSEWKAVDLLQAAATIAAGLVARGDEEEWTQNEIATASVSIAKRIASRVIHG